MMLQSLRRRIEAPMTERDLQYDKSSKWMIMGNRFEKLPKTVKAQIENITDLKRLQDLLLHAANCNSLNEFRQHLT